MNKHTRKPNVRPAWRRDYELDDDRHLSWQTKRRLALGLSPVIRPCRQLQSRRMPGWWFVTLGLLGLTLALAAVLLLEYWMGGAQ
jgi:hypothetical protein